MSNKAYIVCDLMIINIFQIFDEILVNAADNKQRDPKMDTIKIDIKPEENLIKVIIRNKDVWDMVR